MSCKCKTQEYILTTCMRYNAESGTIEFPEFLKLMVRKMKAPDNEAELTDALRVFDLDNNGFISAEHLRHVLTNYGEVLNTTEIDTLICAASIDGQIKYVGTYT